MTERRDPDGTLPLSRTGPFVPPVTIAGISDLLVTDDFRSLVENSPLIGFGFKEVRKKRIVKLDWRAWDLEAANPARWPAGGEPENYVEGREHHEATSEALGTIWEVVIEGLPDDHGHADIVRSAPTDFSRILVNDKAREWLHTFAAEWLRFEAET